MTTNEFSKLIKDKRIALNLTQKEVADNLHVSNKSVSRWETGNGYPDIETIPKLARLLNLSYDELLDGNEFIVKKEKKKRRICLISIILTVCICLLVGYTGYQNNKTFSSKYKNKDLLASQEMANNVKLYIHIPEDDTTSLGWEYHFNEARSKAFLELIDIDQLVKLPDDKIKEISSSDYQWMGTFSFKDKDDYILRLHTYQDSKNTYFQFSDNGVYHDLNHGEIYYLNKLVDLSYDNLIKTLELYVDFNQYDYRHSITNKSDLLVPLTKEEIIDLLELRYVMNDFETLEHGIVYDNINKQQYLIVKSKRKDYQTIDATIKNNKLIVEFKASDAVYFKDYLHVFKINGSVKEYEFYMNGKEDIPTFG